MMLVAGARRLRACERLGWKTIPARRWSDLSWDELRDIELAENEQRLDLTTDEQSPQLVDAAGEAIQEASAENQQKPRGRLQRFECQGSRCALPDLTGFHAVATDTCEEGIRQVRPRLCPSVRPGAVDLRYG